MLFHIRARPVLLQYNYFFDNILKILVTCPRLVIEIFSKLYEELFGKKCDSASEKLHSALYTFIVAGISYITWIS